VLYFEGLMMNNNALVDICGHPQEKAKLKKKI
jgi:hypothetical protein